MKFISSTKEHQVVLLHKRLKMVDTKNAGTYAEVIPGIRAKFRPLAEPFSTNLLVTKEGLARGWLDSEQVVKDNYHAIHQHNVDEQWVIDRLMNHPSYGTGFVAVDEDGNLADTESTFITQNDDGSFYCSLCDATVATAQGLNGHKRSKVHQSYLAHASDSALEKSELTEAIVAS